MSPTWGEPVTQCTPLKAQHMTIWHRKNTNTCTHAHRHNRVDQKTNKKKGPIKTQRPIGLTVIMVFLITLRWIFLFMRSRKLNTDSSLQYHITFFLYNFLFLYKCQQAYSYTHVNWVNNSILLALKFNPILKIPVLLPIKLSLIAQQFYPFINLALPVTLALVQTIPDPNTRSPDFRGLILANEECRQCTKGFHWWNLFCLKSRRLDSVWR